MTVIRKAKGVHGTCDGTESSSAFYTGAGGKGTEEYGCKVRAPKIAGFASLFHSTIKT